LKRLLRQCLPDGLSGWLGKSLALPILGCYIWTVASYHGYVWVCGQRLGNHLTFPKGAARTGTDRFRLLVRYRTALLNGIAKVH